MLVVFLLLAALYESWSIPLSVMLVIPLGIVGAILAATVRGLYNDIYFQVGLLDDDGPVGEERDPDRGVRGRRAEARRIHPRRGAGRRAAPPAADPDDVARLRRRRRCLSRSRPAPARPARTTSAPASIGGMLSATALAIFFVPLFYEVVRERFK